MKEYILTVAVMIYSSDGTESQRNAQELRFSDQRTCLEVQNTLSSHNWRNPFPVPASGKYYMTRWQLAGDCAEPPVEPAPEPPAQQENKRGQVPGLQP